MPIPQNAQAIWNYLLGQGFTDNAAAGILGNIEQESGGSPTAGSNPPGAGLIQILGDPGSSDLNTELARTMAYINQNGSVSDINAHASSPTAAAQYFSDRYERPNPAYANNPNRIQSAIDVLAASKSGNWQSTPSTPASTDSAAGASLGGILSWPSDIVGFFKDAKTFVDAIMWLLKPSSWVRMGSFFIALLLLAMAILLFTKVGSDSPLIRAPSTIPIPIPV